MSLARRVTLLFVTLLAVVLALGALVTLGVLAQRDAERRETRLLDASLTASHELALGQARLTESLAALVQTRDPQLRADVATQIADQAQRVGDLIATSAQDARLRDIAGPLRDALAAASDQAVQPILGAVDAGDLDRARELLASDRTQASAEQVRAAIQGVYSGLAGRRALVDAQLDDSWRTLLITIIAAAVSLVLAWLAVLRIMQRGVLAPIDEIRRSLRETAMDRHSAIEARGPDEIRALAVDAEAMRRELVRQADEAEAARLALLEDAPLTAEIQAAMRPRLPDVSWLRMHGTTRPGEGVVAGDWWDAIARPDGSIAIVIADVSGHGVGAGTAAVQVRAVLDSSLAAGASAADAVALARHALGAGTHFVTLVIVVIDDDGLTWVNAGHPPPVIVRADASTDRCVPTGPMLSRLGGDWQERRVPFPAGSVLVAFTDGLTEAVDATGSELDEAEIIAWVRGEAATVRDDPRELAERLLARVRRRAVALPDDVTVLCVGRPTR